ncbi:BRCT domain [Sesbania bispinosa]|nr:BRCT domain [Sesbania bispinosa]
MAPKRKPSSPISIGNCEITVEASRFTCNSDSNDLLISLPRSGKIKVSVVKDVSANDQNASENFKSKDKEHDFVLVNPKDVDDVSKSYLQEVLQMYMTELPGMNYAANTGKLSKFLERCVTNGKYRTLLLKSSSVGDSGKVIAAITYQIIPADTEYAEIPLAAVNANYQRKVFPVNTELLKRLQNVGIRSIFCWGDKASEGFWLKQGFLSIAQVDTKGRARRLPVKADIRKSLCFPGGSTLMVFHLRKGFLADDANAVKCLPSQLHQNSFTPAIVENTQLEFSGGLHIDLKFSNLSSHKTATDQSQPEVLVKDGSSREYDRLSGFDSHNPKNCRRDVVPFARANDDRHATAADCSQDGIDANVKYSQSTKGEKRAWEASLSSLKSKRVKGSQLVDCRSDSSWGFISEADRANPCFVEVPHVDIVKNSEKCIGDYLHLEAPTNIELPTSKQCIKIMLMNIADDAKKMQLTKVIEDLGGTIAYDGNATTHVVTGKVRKTLNFCTALCSGAWVVSSSWLKESFREGRFVDELPHILNDKDYQLKYKSDLKSAISRAKASPHALFKGYNICIAAHVQTTAKTLTAIVRSAGANVIHGLENVNEASTTIFVACEEDTEEAMMAAKKGIRTFSSEWFMNCVMRQELDLEASQFAESL